MEDLTNKKIDMLYVEEMIVQKPYNKRKYRCKCDCGNVCTRLHASLKNEKHIHSCGCYQKENLKPGDTKLCSKAGKHRKDTFVNGSNVQMTFREGTISTNTSGIQGVSWSNSAHKWHVYVGYQNYRANLGFFEDIKIAIQIRKMAEEAIKNDTFEDFYYVMRGFHLGEKNQKQFKKK